MTDFIGTTPNACNTFRDKLVFYLMRVYRYSGESSFVYITGTEYNEEYTNVKLFVAILGMLPILLAWELPVTYLFYKYKLKFDGII